MPSTRSALRSAPAHTNNHPTSSSPTSPKPISTSTTSPTPSISHTSPPLSPPPSPPPPPALPTPALESARLRYSYAIARGETGVLTFEPYKSLLLPHWAFRTVPVARRSSRTLWAVFRCYVVRRDFVGADMARKFVQMGMTRARRYANHKGGRKYARVVEEEKDKDRDKDKEKGRQELARWTGGSAEEVRKRREKEEASEIFKAVWRRCIADEEYQALKKKWMGEKRLFEKGRLEGG